MPTRFTPLPSGLVLVEPLDNDDPAVELTPNQAADYLRGNVYHRSDDEWVDSWLDALG